MFGFLNVDKPEGLTSFDVIARLRKVCGVKQIGHAGTLDPLATGVLPIAIGKATRLVEYLPSTKGYVADLLLGKVSDTYDTEGVVVEFAKTKVDEANLNEALCVFKGEIEQTPPMYSAVHYKGKRLYELARKGEVVEDIPKRKVFVGTCELLSFDYETQSAKILVKCSGGTYIRSIIHDLGQNLGGGAVMSGLRRTQSQGMDIDNSVKLENIKIREDVLSRLINPICLLDKNRVELTQKEYDKVKTGQPIQSNSSELMGNDLILLTKDDELCAVAEVDGAMMKIRKVFI